jgi:tRNA pseudouridine55 synthase
MTITEFQPNVFGVDKPAGWTPLQALSELRNLRPDLKDSPLTYAGRLDPMAEGLLLVLANDKVHEKDKFLGLDKWYTVTALLGVTTDSYDLLGMPQKGAGTLDLDSGSIAIQQPTEADGMTEKIKEILSSYVGQTTLPLPLYSSPPYLGKPLFKHAQEKSMEPEHAPQRTTTIFRCDFDYTGSVSAEELLSYVRTTIPQAHGEFRQLEIVKTWEQLLSSDHPMRTVTWTIHCSSGTYIRSLVRDFGEKLGTGACVYMLRRTQVGPYAL